jgi:hypothetical protein
LLGEFAENTGIHAVEQQVLNRRVVLSDAARAGILDMVSDRVEDSVGQWIRNGRWFNGHAISEADYEEMAMREFLSAGTRSVTHLLTRDAQGAIQEGRQAVERGLEPLRRFTEDDF